MLTMADLIAVLSLCLTSYNIYLTQICVCVKYMLYEKDEVV